MWTMALPLRKKLLALGGYVKRKYRLASQKISKKILDNLKKIKYNKDVKRKENN